MNDDEFFDEIQRLLDIEAQGFRGGYSRWRDACHRVYPLLSRATAASLVIHNADPPHLRCTPDETILTFEGIGPVNLARIREHYPYTGPSGRDDIQPLDPVPPKKRSRTEYRPHLSIGPIAFRLRGDSSVADSENVAREIVARYAAAESE
jgi:hypothetical protein